MQVYYDVERYDNRTYTPKTVTKDDDYSIAPLTGLGSSWSVTFDWLPLNGNLCFPEVGANTTVPIATIQGATGYIELYWDRTAYDGAGGGQAFKLFDGTNTVSLDADQGGAAMEWLHNDILKFGITSDGTTTILYCFNPENGDIHGSAILSKSGGAVIDVPAQIDLGSNEDNTVIGTGAFANIRGFNTVLSDSEIETTFNSTEAIKGVDINVLQPAKSGFIVNALSVDASGKETIVPAVDGKSHFVKSLTITCVTAITVTVQDNSSSPIELLGPVPFNTTSKPLVIEYADPIKVEQGKQIDISSSGIGNITVVIQGYTE
jgi:hypothetical protein